MEIMSKTDAINCAFNEGLDSLRKHLQDSADVADGGQLTETDLEFIQTAESFMANDSYVEFVRMLQRGIEWSNNRIKALEDERDRLLTRVSELEESLANSED